MNEAKIFFDGERAGKPHIKVLEADYGDTDPTSDSNVGLLAGYYYTNSNTNEFQFIGSDLTEVFVWIKTVMATL